MTTVIPNESNDVLYLLIFSRRTRDLRCVVQIQIQIALKKQSSSEPFSYLILRDTNWVLDQKHYSPSSSGLPPCFPHYLTDCTNTDCTNIDCTDYTDTLFCLTHSARKTDAHSTSVMGEESSQTPPIPPAESGPVPVGVLGGVTSALPLPPFIGSVFVFVSDMDISISISA